ncbi:MAG: hypothetical protein U5L96_04470 [Owenweeksia sp.]|nr:hypothetical protein [Owenweeksia sp.]
MKRVDDPKNWRPHLLVLSGAPTSRWYLVELANDFTQNRALMTVCTTLTTPDVAVERQNAMEQNIRDYLLHRGVNSLVRVFFYRDPFEGAKRLVDTYGLGQMVPNTVLLGASESLQNEARYCDMLLHFFRSRRNIVVVRENKAKGYGKRKRIDIWWGGLKANGGLMIVLAYLLQRSIKWQNAEINLKMLTPSERASEGALENLQYIIGQMRMKVNPQVITNEKRDFWNVLQERSGAADLVFLGMAEPRASQNYQAYYHSLQEKTAGLPTTVFVLASQETTFEDVLS